MNGGLPQSWHKRRHMITQATWARAGIKSHAWRCTLDARPPPPYGKQMFEHYSALAGKESAPPPPPPPKKRVPKMPGQIFPVVNFGFSHEGHFGRGGRDPGQFPDLGISQFLSLPFVLLGGECSIIIIHHPIPNHSEDFCNLNRKLTFIPNQHLNRSTLDY